MYTITKHICTYSSINNHTFSIFSHKHDGSLELTKSFVRSDMVYARRLACVTSFFDESNLLEVLVVLGISESEIAHLFDTLPIFETSIKRDGTWHLLEQISDE